MTEWLTFTLTCFQPGSWGSLINRNSYETREEFQKRLYWDSCCSKERQKKKYVPLLLPKRWVSWSLWLRLEGSWGDLPRLGPPGGAVSRDHRKWPAFASGASEIFLVCGPFTYCSELLPAHACGYSVFVQLYFVVCCPGRCSFSCKNCSKRSQDPGCLIHTSWFHYPLSGEQTFRLFLQHMAVVNHTVWVTGVQVTPSKYWFLHRTSLVVQWLRTCLALWGMWVQSLVGETRSHRTRSS